MVKRKVNIKCTIKSVHAKEPFRDGLNLVENSPVLLRVFVATIRADHKIIGEITVHRSKRDDITGSLIPGEEITGVKLTLTDDETIFVLYDETIVVVPGGVGMGAIAISGLATGGYGGGGEISKDGHKTGGDGQGGDVVGPAAVGKAGRGIGGLVTDGDAGDGAGGEVVRKAPASTAGVPG